MSTPVPLINDADELVRRAAENDCQLRDLRSLELSIIAAEDLPTLFPQIRIHFQRNDPGALVRLTLADADGAIARILQEGDPASQQNDDIFCVTAPGDLRRLGTIEPRPKLLVRRAGLPNFLLPTPGISRTVHCSLAILPLIRRGTIIGALTVVSRDPDRFDPSMATDFLTGFASVLALSIENSINRCRLERLSMTDALTELRNRRFLDSRINEELARAARANTPLSLALFDVDHFKSVNDRYGHGAGDVVLQRLARRVKDAVRRIDVACRYGGEEIAVLMPDTDAGRALEVAERVRLAVAATPCLIPTGPPIRVTVSGGLATQAVPVSSTHLDASRLALCERADVALYRSKAQGRNRISTVSSAA